MAAGFYVPLVADWCKPGIGLNEAAVALGALPGVSHTFLWSRIVRLIGRDVALLGTVSMVSAFACAILIAFLAGDLLAVALRRMRRHVSLSDGEANVIRRYAELLTALAFVLTPGFFRAATHVGPLHTLLLPFLLGMALLMRFLTMTDEKGLVARLKEHSVRLFLILMLLAGSFYEMLLSRRLLLSERSSFVVFALIGILPLFILSHLTRRWRLRSWKAYTLFYAGWAIAVAVSGVVSLRTVDNGYVVSRIVRQIIDNAGNCQAIASDGPLDAMLYFMMPKDRRQILYSRNNDPAYGRELSAWVRKNQGEKHGLVYAAELGPRLLVDEWTACDSKGLQGTILTPTRYFPTLEKWREGYAELAGLRKDEPYLPYLKVLLGSAGNQLGCQFIESGETNKAWTTFWTVLDRVDAENYAALINLSGLLERGYAATWADKNRLVRLRDAVERKFKTPEHRMIAARIGGRLYVDPNVRKRMERERLAALERQELSSQVRSFIETVSAAPRNRESSIRAREEIRKGVAGGLVRLNRIGTQLLMLDRFLDDWDSAEKDAISILRLEREHLTANAVMGTLAGKRGDYPAAEHYLRRAESEEQVEKAVVANDLGFTLVRLGRAREAETYARQAVSLHPDNWNYRETLAIALIRSGKSDEGERELRQAVQQAEKAGVKAGSVVRFALDRAWLQKVRGDAEKLKLSLRVLGERKDLTEPQRGEIGEMWR